MSSLALITSCRRALALRLTCHTGLSLLFEVGVRPPHDGMRRMGRPNLWGALAVGASGRSPAKTLSMIRRRARVHGRRLAWRFGWQRSGDRSVLGCAVRASGGVAEPQRARV